ncbi:MAG: hypothetical protein K1W19_07080 [Lachnospiraceae bacterium]
MDLKKTSKLILGLSVKIVFWILCLTVFIVICSKAFSFGSSIFSEKGMAEKGQGVEITVTIPAGATTSQVADILFDVELIDSKIIFQIQSLLYEAEFAAGDYVLNTENNAVQIIQTLRPPEEE